MANRNRAGTARAKERIVRLKAKGRKQVLVPLLWDGEVKPKRRPRGRLRFAAGKDLMPGPSTGRNVKPVRTQNSTRPPADKAPGAPRKPWCTKRHTKARLLSLAEYRKEKADGQKAAQ